MSKKVKKIKHRDIHDRELYLIHVDSLSEIFPLPEKENSHFGLLLAMDGREEIVENLGEVPERLINEGLAYLCAWGPDCSRVHDIFDLVSVNLEKNTGQDFPIMTTWHEKESLDEALWFLLFCAIPYDELIDKCSTSYIISVGNKKWFSQLDYGLSDIDDLANRVTV
jgi:hypothetical protein